MSESVLEVADLVFGNNVQVILDKFSGDDVTDAYLERLALVIKDARETMLREGYGLL